MEGDLLRFYQVDLLDWYRGTLSTRRLLNLVYQLPRESAFLAALSGRPRRSSVEERIMDIPEALTGKAHPIRAAERQAERAIEQAPARAAALAKAAAHREKKRRARE